MASRCSSPIRQRPLPTPWSRSTPIAISGIASHVLESVGLRTLPAQGHASASESVQAQTTALECVRVSSQAEYAEHLARDAARLTQQAEAEQQLLRNHGYNGRPFYVEGYCIACH